ncbi:MFS transporter [Bradyrhizobium sp. Tv2a-2]|uniref:MFS transporter n=1 Tax=Bradyrhizobium sp. Tv2a-2 TaxID=113395 RepID=UPI0004241D3B|nr:MFS transporter [Bradyrhizobium sp. Tv2a-2]
MNATADCCTDTSRTSREGLSTPILLTFAITCGISVANIYYAQPLLDALASSFAIPASTIGMVVTLTQVGYALGLVFLVPFGDIIDRRRLIVAQVAASAVALLAVGTARSPATLFIAMVVMGLLAVVIQVIVAYTAALATPSQRGASVGLVTSGVVIGILAARSVSGAIADIGGWRAVYLTSAILTLSAGLALAWLLPNDRACRSRESYGAVLRSMTILLRTDPLLRTRATLAMLTFASFSTLWTSIVLPLRAPPMSLSHTEIGLLGLAGMAGAAAARSAGRLADRGWADLTTVSALSLLLASWVPIGLLHHSMGALVLGIILLDLAVQAIHVTNQSVIFAGRPEATSRLVGCYMLFYSIGSGAGAIASTGMYAVAGWAGVAGLGASFAAAGLLFWLRTAQRS